MKLQRKDICIVISFIFVLSLSLLAAVTDYDYVWQTILGKTIVTEGNFEGLHNLIWSTEYVGWYVDHEWLTNVIFYLLTSCFGELGGIVCYKLCVSVLLSLEIVILCKVFNITTLNIKLWLVSLFVGIVYALKYINFKAYDISLLLLLALVILLERNKTDIRDFKVFAITYLAIIILWNNLHSGSVFLAILVAFIYWVLIYKDKRTLVLGFCSVLCLCVNPFGYKLLLFDIYHFSDTTMKSISTDWAMLSISSNADKVILCSLIIGFLCLVYQKVAFNEPLLWLYVLFVSLTIISARHFLYCYPFFVIVLLRCNQVVNREEVYKYIVWCLSIGVVVIQLYYWVNLQDSTVDYLHHYITKDMLVTIQNTVEENTKGFYDSDLDVWNYGIKSFKVGAFTYTEEQNIATYVLNHGSVVQIKDIIEKYQLNKFLVAKYKKTALGTQHTNMYDFLLNSAEYELMCENERLAYFVAIK